MVSSPDDLESGMTTRRIEALTDGIFAIAMTLLVLNLALPEPGQAVPGFVPPFLSIQRASLLRSLHI